MSPEASAKQLKKTASQAGAEYNGITDGVIWQQLLLFFFPILFGTFFQQLYNTADAVIVGHFVGKEALAAVGGTTGTLINLLVGFFVGLSSGATVIISQFYGAKQDSRVSHAVHTAIAFAIAGGFVLMLIGFFGAPLALRAMGTPDDIMEYALVYIRIYFLGTIANLIYNMGAGILRAVGDSKRPLYFLMASCLTNIVPVSYTHLCQRMCSSPTSPGEHMQSGATAMTPFGRWTRDSSGCLERNWRCERKGSDAP